MKRNLYILFLSLAMMIVLVACGEDDQTTSSDEEISSAQESSSTEESVETSTDDTVESSESTETDITYTAGTYTGVAEGTGGPIEVEVTFSEDAITDIQIAEDNESAGMGEQVFAIIPDQVIEYQSLSVDNVSGATITSSALKNAITDAVEQADGDVEALRSVEAPSTAEDGEYEYDVVVVGGGLAGLSAAIEAAELGADVALIEKTGILGGTSIFASGNLLGATDEEYKQPMYEQWHQRSKIQEENPIDDDRLNYLIDRSPEVMSFLMDDVGVEFNITIEDNGSQTFRAAPNEKAKKNAAAMSLPSKEPNAKGAANMIEKLSDSLENAGVDLYLNTPATELIQDEVGGPVTGVISDSENGTKTFNAKAVVLASGDYARNEEMTQELAPQAAGEITASAVGNTGDGHHMAVDAGGYYYDYQESMTGVFQANPYDLHYVGDPSNNYPFEAILVDWNGERKYAEDGGSHPQKYHFVDEERLNGAWAIMDAPIAENFNNLDEYLQATEEGSDVVKVYQADSIEELAEKAGLPVDTVVQEVEDYNELAASGEDTEFGKDPEFLEPIDEGPYYIAFLYDCTRGNYGGIATDKYGAVITEEGTPIPGLYAGGIISSAPYFGDYYPGREAIAIASHMGYISGESAANYALENETQSE